jgi:hypothetical protein
MGELPRDLETYAPDLKAYLALRRASEAAVLTLWNEAGTDRAQFSRWLKRLMAGDQLEYILGWQMFDGERYHSDRRAYIAQADSLAFLDRLVIEAGRLLAVHGRSLKICEVGVGSGAFLSALSKRFRAAGIHISCWVGLDIDAAALEVARINCAREDIPLRLAESDILSELASNEEPDLIYAYPPWGDQFAPNDDFEGTEWELFHRALPQISCYSVGGKTRIHEDILESALARFPSSEVHIFNDHLPISDVDRILTRFPGLVAETCGQGMTAFARRI